MPTDNRSGQGAQRSGQQQKPDEKDQRHKDPQQHDPNRQGGPQPVQDDGPEKSGNQEYKLPGEKLPR